MEKTKQTIKQICDQYNGLVQEDIEKNMKIMIGKDCMIVTKNI